MPNSSPPKTALIIGASRGLGYAMAEEHLKRGWARMERDGPDAPLNMDGSLPNLVNVLMGVQGKAGRQYLD